MFPGASGTSYIKQGKIRALGVGSLEPSPLLPGVPTIASTVPGFEAVSPQGIFAPAKTPPAIVAKLQQEIAKALNAPEAKERAFATGNQVVANTPEAFTAWLKTDIDRAAKLIKRQGIKEE
jgi:tripartite-type tricarboxylate transporter receptor subunit TctC